MTYIPEKIIYIGSKLAFRVNGNRIDVEITVPDEKGSHEEVADIDKADAEQLIEFLQSCLDDLT